LSAALNLLENPTDIDVLLASVVPPIHASWSTSRQQRDCGGKQVWERSSLQQPVDRRNLFEYLRYLVLNHEASRRHGHGSKRNLSIWRPIRLHPKPAD